MELLILFIPSILSLFIYYHNNPDKKMIEYLFVYGHFCFLNNMIYLLAKYIYKGNDPIVYSEMSPLALMLHLTIVYVIAFFSANIIVILQKKYGLYSNYVKEQE